MNSAIKELVLVPVLSLHHWVVLFTFDWLVGADVIGKDLARSLMDEGWRKLGARMMSWLRSLCIGMHSYIDGHTTGEKKISIRSNYPKVLKMMKRRHIPRNGMLLL